MKKPFSLLLCAVALGESALPDGDYVLEATVRSGGEEITATRKMSLVGAQTARREADIARREAELRREAPNLSKDELFTRRVELHDLRRALEKDFSR